MSLSAGYTWVNGDVVTATKLNLAGVPTFGAGTAAAPTVAAATDTDTGFYWPAANTTGWSANGLSYGTLGVGMQSYNGDDTTGGGNLYQIGFGFGAQPYYRHFIQTRHTAAVGGSGNALALWINNSATNTASSAPGTNNVKVIDAAASGVALLGTNTNDSASAGWVGEYMSSSAGVTAVNLTDSICSNITTLSLTAGDWDVSGTVIYNPAGGTTTTILAGGVSQTSATLPGSGDGLFRGAQGFTNGQQQYIPTPTVRISLAAGATIYLVITALFSASTAQAGGFIRARRVR